MEHHPNHLDAGGRPASFKGIRAHAARRAKEAIEALAEVAGSVESPSDARVRAAESLLDHALGCPRHSDIAYRMLWSLKSLGTAYQKGVLLIDENAPPGLKTEVKVILAELVKFAESIPNR